MPSVAVLFARSDSIYKTLPECDVYDIERDARTYRGELPVIAHPPCRAWGRLRHFAKPRPDEKDLALFAVEKVRERGGVLEHPEFSTLWPAADLPRPGEGFDDWGGWTLPVPQFWFGHRAMKWTWLYIVGRRPATIPDIPLILGDSPCVIAQSHDRKAGRRTKNSPGWRPEVTEREREATPAAFARFLIQLAEKASV